MRTLYYESAPQIVQMLTNGDKAKSLTAVQEMLSLQLQEILGKETIATKSVMRAAPYLASFYGIPLCFFSVNRWATFTLTSFVLANVVTFMGAHWLYEKRKFELRELEMLKKEGSEKREASQENGVGNHEASQEKELEKHEASQDKELGNREASQDKGIEKHETSQEVEKHETSQEARALLVLGAVIGAITPLSVSFSANGVALGSLVFLLSTALATSLDCMQILSAQLKIRTFELSLLEDEKNRESKLFKEMLDKKIKEYSESQNKANDALGIINAEGLTWDKKIALLEERKEAEQTKVAAAVQQIEKNAPAINELIGVVSPPEQEKMATAVQQIEENVPAINKPIGVVSQLEQVAGDHAELLKSLKKEKENYEWAQRKARALKRVEHFQRHLKSAEVQGYTKGAAITMLTVQGLQMNNLKHVGTALSSVEKGFSWLKNNGLQGVAKPSVKTNSNQQSAQVEQVDDGQQNGITWKQIFGVVVVVGAAVGAYCWYRSSCKKEQQQPLSQEDQQEMNLWKNKMELLKLLEEENEKIIRLGELKKDLEFTEKAVAVAKNAKKNEEKHEQEIAQLKEEHRQKEDKLDARIEALKAKISNLTEQLKAKAVEAGSSAKISASAETVINPGVLKEVVNNAEAEEAISIAA
jgi:hypothetical protein